MTIKFYEPGVKAWEPTGGFEQLKQAASLPFVQPYIAATSTVGSVIPTRGAVVPAAAGVDIGCGMVAVRTNIPAERLPDGIYNDICAAVPIHSHREPSDAHTATWDAKLLIPFTKINYWMSKHTTKQLSEKNSIRQLGTLGGGNHFIEVCLDEFGDVCFILVLAGWVIESDNIFSPLGCHGWGGEMPTVHKVIEHIREVLCPTQLNS